MKRMGATVDYPVEVVYHEEWPNDCSVTIYQRADVDHEAVEKARWERVQKITREVALRAIARRQAEAEAKEREAYEQKV